MNKPNVYMGTLTPSWGNKKNIKTITFSVTDECNQRCTNTKTGSAVFLLFLTENWVAQIGRGLFFSADLCYNDTGDVNG